MFQALGAATLKARSPNLSLDHGRNRSRFDADLKTVGRVDSVKTGFSRLEMVFWDYIVSLLVLVVPRGDLNLLKEQ